MKENKNSEPEQNRKWRVQQHCIHIIRVKLIYLTKSKTDLFNIVFIRCASGYRY
jgi:hypothetical protein